MLDNTSAAPSPLYDYTKHSPEIAESLRKQAARMKAAVKSTVSVIIEIGRDLLAGRQHLQHGQFWHVGRAECRFTKSTPPEAGIEVIKQTHQDLRSAGATIGTAGSLDEALNLLAEWGCCDDQVRLQRRREHRVVEHASFRLTVGYSRYPSGCLGEVFIDTHKGGTAIDTLLRDASLLSFALQYGASAAEIRSALAPTGPIAAVHD
jgi:hypothetical protein